MINIFSDPMRRNPFPLYDQLRSTSPVMHEPRTGLWMIFDYDGVQRTLTDHQNFSSRLGPAQWMGFNDPPRHTKLRALVSRAFTPKSVVNLEPRIADLSRRLLDAVISNGAMDLAADYSIQLPMLVIAEMLGIASDDLGQFKRWNDVILDMSFTIGAPKTETVPVVKAFEEATGEMSEYLGRVLAQRRSQPRDDLLTRLSEADIDGQRLTHEEILGFFQLLLLAGQETSTNLINNAIVCLLENPDQLALLRQQMNLLPSAIEEVLRFRSPLQWMIRRTTCDTEMPMNGGGVAIAAGKVVLAMIGSANRDPRYFPNANQFDMQRSPNPHIAFGHGVHFCLGAPLARLEARIALTDLLTRLHDLKRATDEPWEPRKALHVHGPTRLPVTFRVA
jgi:cytochrome P450